MTRSQYRIFNRLQKRQVNHDVSVVESSNTSITFHVPFPGLYLTYNDVGHLLATETTAERLASGRPMQWAGHTGEVGADMNQTPVKSIQVEDDDVPF